MNENCVLRQTLEDNPGLTKLAYISFGILILVTAVLMSLSIHRVTVHLGSKTVSYYTFAPLVGDVIREVGVKGNIGLQKSPVSLAEGETVNFYTVSEDLVSEVKDGMNISVFEDRIAKDVRNESISPPIIREWNIFLETDRERIINPGKSGLRQNTFLTRFRDGVVISSQKTGSRLVAVARPRVIASGSYEAVSRQGVRYSGKPLRFESTAYSFTGYHTAVGADTRRGIVAVDPKVIPLGTKMFIEGYGYAVAADTGGAIKGKRLDLFFENRGDAVKCGRRQVNFFIL
ncbi:MAG: G5 and 3D domain-containing protein [Eubacteriales bacterium]